jgi:uncharacterized protein
MAAGITGTTFGITGSAGEGPEAKHVHSALIHTLVLQPTPFCNINCSYCYLPQRDAKTVMTLETVVAIFEKIFASGWSSPHLTVIWHAGEPLVLPVSYYQAAFEAIEALRPASLELRHCIQTNGMLINPDWCDFFKKWRVGLGVSVDGPRRLHDANRVTRAGKGTFDRTIAGVRLLRRENVPFHVISVLSEKSMRLPEEMLEFYLAEGIEDICFNVEESEGIHISGLLSGSNPTESFRYFLDRFWTLSRQSERIHFIREIDTMIQSIFRPTGTPTENIQVEPFAMLNIDCHGNVSSFSPELLGYKNAKYNDFIVGNIRKDSLEDMRQSPAMLAMSGDIAAGVDACRAECEYFSVCGGGAPVNKLTENGSFRSSRTQFCGLVQMVPTDLVLSALDRLETKFDNAAAKAPLTDAVVALQSTPRPAHSPMHDGVNGFGPDIPDFGIHEMERGSR